MTASVRAMCAVLVCLFLVTACGSPVHDEKVQVTLPNANVGVGDVQIGEAQTARARIPRGFREYYRQDLIWSRCDTHYECATVQAPLDWSDPDSETTTIALQRLNAAADRQGSLLINPGGPGGSGTDFVSSAEYLISENVRDSYDLIGFDPRGTGRSAPIRCYSDEQWDRYITNGMTTTTPLADQEIIARSFALACLRNGGDILAYADTQSVARDMDLIRAVVGSRRLNFLGYSYGTLLGSTYAGLFPANVGRIVLDGAIDPTLSADELMLGQAQGFERALRRYVTYCLKRSDCPLAGTVDEALGSIRDLLNGLVTNPMPTSDPDRPLTAALGAAGVAYPLYASWQWPALTSALDRAINDLDGTQLLADADAYNSRNPDGTFADNSGQAFVAINCLEPRVDAAADHLALIHEQLTSVAPTLADTWPTDAVQCNAWRAPAQSRDYEMAAAGASPIMVIGTTGDPATPYEWAQGLARVLESGFLVTYDGDGHGAYGASNQCVADTVDNFLLEGIVPLDAVSC